MGLSNLEGYLFESAAIKSSDLMDQLALQVLRNMCIEVL